MHSTTQLRKWRDDLKAMVAKTHPIRDKFLAEKAVIEADGSRRDDYVREHVGEARDTAYAALGKHVNEARHLAQVVAADAAVWRSIPFVLSRQRFDKDNAAAESMLRAQWHRELSQAPGGLFALMVEDAKRMNNGAALFQAYLVQQTRHGEKGFHSIDFSKITIPEQEEALALIAECVTMPAQAEMVVGQISGRVDPNPLATARSVTPAPLTPTLGFDVPSELPRDPDAAAATIDPNASPLDRLQRGRAPQKEAA